MAIDLVATFIENVKQNSVYSKCVKRYVIDKMITIFDGSYTKKQYPRNINNPMQIALEFYKQYNYEYYQIIIDGIKDKRIIIDDKIKASYTDQYENKTYIKLNGNDRDLYMLVHELAHFVDRSLTPNIIPDKYNFLCETFSFYMERQLEKYLIKQNGNYDELITIRNNNRVYFESKFIKHIKSQLYYEDLYKKQGIISEGQIDIEEAKELLGYNVSNIVNYLLRYPLGNVLSEYIIKNNLLKSDSDICQVCLKLDLNVVLDDYILSKNKTRTMK